MLAANAPMMLRMLASFLVYAGFVLSVVGLICLIRPWARVRLSSRKRAALAAMIGVVLVVLGMRLPVSETRVSSEQSRLDHFMARYQFSEFHSIRVEAPPERVYRAMRSVTASEIRLFRTLTWIRRMGKPGPEGILNAPEHQPLLDVATRTSFRLLAEDEGQEIVVGTAILAPKGWRPKENFDPEDFRSVEAPGFVLAAMNFRIQGLAPGVTLLTTETRIYATDSASQRKFARYWSVVYPGSALIRRMWLSAIRKRSLSPLLE